MARTYAYLMERNARLDPRMIFADIDETIRKTLERSLAGSNRTSGLLGRALQRVMMALAQQADHAAPDIDPVANPRYPSRIEGSAAGVTSMQAPFVERT